MRRICRLQRHYESLGWYIMAVRRMSAMGQKDVHFSPARPSDAMKVGGWRRGGGGTVDAIKHHEWSFIEKNITTISTIEARKHIVDQRELAFLFLAFTLFRLTKKRYSSHLTPCYSLSTNNVVSTAFSCVTAWRSNSFRHYERRTDCKTYFGSQRETCLQRSFKWLHFSFL